MTVKRFTPRKTPYAEMIALPDGEYVRHEDYAALELHNEYLLARLRKQGEQLDAIGAGGVSSQRITSQRGEPFMYLRTLNGKPDWGDDCVADCESDLIHDEEMYAEGYGVMPLYTAPQPAAAMEQQT